MGGLKKREKLLTEGELVALYPKEYVLVEVVLGKNRPEWKKGRLIAHSSDKDEVLDVVESFVKRHPGAQTALFFTGPADDYAPVIGWTV